MHTNLLKLIIVPIAVWFASTKCHADLVLTFDVGVSTPDIRLGESVDWNVFVTVSEGLDAGVTMDNFGIATTSFSLADSRGATLTPAIIAGDFSGYFPAGGDFFGGQLLGVGVTLFSQSDGAVRGADEINVAGRGGLGPFLLATGSYTPTETGLHTLSSSLFDPSEYFTARGQFVGAGRQFDEVQFGSANFSVTAIPEPSSLIVVALGTCILSLRRRARHHFTVGSELLI